MKTVDRVKPGPRVRIPPPPLTPPELSFSQPGANSAGWHNSRAREHTVADGGYSGIFSLACKVNETSASLDGVEDDSAKRSGDLYVADEGRHEIACDAEDGAGNKGSGSNTLLIDKTKPNTPAISADRAPEYSEGGEDWYRDSATLSFAAAGDPDLADGTDGSGVDPASVPGAAIYGTSGTHTMSGTVKDTAGNTSDSASKTVKVDATDPSMTVTCPESVYLRGRAEATTEASDGESGLASAPSAAVDTSTVGPKTVSVTATDRVGNTTTKNCTTKVVYKFAGFQPPINADGSSVFKLGSTVSTKILLTDANGAPVEGALATLQVAKRTANVEGEFDEATSTVAASTGSRFQDAGSGRYFYNLGTKSLSTGTWILRASLDDGTSHAVQVSLR